MKSRVVSLAAAILMVVASGAASSDMCSSPEFREAFLANQQYAPIDWLDVDQSLLAYGDEAIPCLLSIVKKGGPAHGLSGCIEGPNGCAVWAVRALAEIGSGSAKETLTEILQEDIATRPLVTAIIMLGVLKVTDNRSQLLRLLSHREPQVRAESIVRLGWIGNRADFAAMLEATLTLPDEHIYRGAQGLLQLGDYRAIGPLTVRARTVKVPITREQLRKRIDEARKTRDSFSAK